MSSWQFYERAQKEVYRKLKARERPQAVVGAGWGFLDHFFIFLFSLGFFARVDFRLKRVKRVMVPTLLMILTYEVKQLIGVSSMNQLEEHLFRDTALLKIIGFTARQIQEGFCQRGKGKRRGPMHRDTLGGFSLSIYREGGGFYFRGGGAGLGQAQAGAGKDLYSGCYGFADDGALSRLRSQKGGEEGLE